MEGLATEIVAECSAPPGTGGSAEIRALLVERLNGHPAAARRRALRQWLGAGGVAIETVDFAAMGRIESLLEEARGSAAAPLPGGWIVRRAYDRLWVERSGGPGAQAFSAEVRVPGETLVPEAGLRVVVALASGVIREKTVRPGRLPARASLAARELGRGRLVVRSWRPGDRMRPLGLGGSRKLQDIFVDAKVPAMQRPTVPVFECRGQIVWLPGYRVASGWEVSDSSDIALQIAVEGV